MIASVERAIAERIQRELRDEPHGVALARRDRVVRKGELASRVERLMGGLSRVDSGAVVAAKLDDVIDSTAMLLACLTSGRIFVAQRPGRQALLPNGIRPDLFVGDAAEPDIGCAQGDYSSLDQLAAGRPVRHINEGPIAYAVSTSGSTGDAKLVFANANGTAIFADWWTREMGLGRDGVWGEPGPLWHDMPLVNVLTALSVGSPVRFLPEAVPRACDVAGLTALRSLPERLAMLLHVARGRRYSLRSLRWVGTGGGGLTHAGALAALDGVAGARLVSTYGTTESTGFAASQPVTRGALSEWPHDSWIPLGAQTPGWTLDLPDRGEAELVIAGEHLAFQEYRDASATVARRVHRTGDLAWRRGGDLILVGRLNRLVKKFGEWVSLDRIDLVLSQALGVPCASVQVADQVVTFAEAGADASDGESFADETRAVAREALGWQAQPQKVFQCKRLPRTGSGKLDLQRLAELAERIVGPAPVGSTIPALD